MKIEEIYAIPVDGDGWRILPNGHRLKLFHNVSAPYGLNEARIGDGASIGNGASIGAWASIGNGASIGNWASIGDEAIISNGASIGNWASIGDEAIIGAWASIPVGVELKFTPLAVQGTRHLVTNCAPGQISIGCQFFTFAEFLAASPEQRTAYQTAAGYTLTQCAEYIKIVEFVIANGSQLI